MFCVNRKYQIIISILVFTISINYAQKKKPIRTTSVPQDTSITIQEKPENLLPTESGLPTIELKEHTIVGERIITNVPDSKKITDKSNVPAITLNPTGEGKGNRLVSGAGGIKMDQSIFYPTTNINNELYLSYGRYNDVNVGLKLKKQFIDDELFADLDYRWNGGYMDNSEYNYFRNTITNIHRFNRYIQNKTQFSLTDYTHRFYGAKVNPDEQRSRVNIDISSTTGITGWDIANLRWDAGIRYMDPDNTQLFNWGLWTDLNISKTVGSSFLTGIIKLNSDRIEIPLNPNQLDSLHAWVDRNRNEVPITFIEKVRDDITNNSLLSSAFFGNAQTTLEHVFARNLKVKGGINIFYYNNSNKHYVLYENSYYDKKILEDELTTVYPILGLEFNLGPMGSLFGQFEPKLSNISLVQILNSNPYTNMSAPLSYQDVVSDIKIGWKRSGTYDLSFETYYNYKDVNNFGIFAPQTLGNANENIGHWDYIFNNDIKLHELRALLNWQANDKISIWSSTGFRNYEINKSKYADQIPYFPKFDLEFAIRILPGYGIEMHLNGQFLSEQLTVQNKANNNDNEKIDPHFISNFTISKKFGNHFEIYGQLNNILDTEYEIWKGYTAPPFNGWVGFKVFW